MLHCMYVAHPSILLLMDVQVAPRPGFCERCRSGHSGARIPLDHAVLWIRAQEWGWVIGQLYFRLFKDLLTVLPVAVPIYSLPNSVRGFPPLYSAAALLVDLLRMTILMGAR